MEMAAFLERAKWAGVTVTGRFSERLWNYVDCVDASGVTTCTIENVQ